MQQARLERLSGRSGGVMNDYDNRAHDGASRLGGEYVYIVAS